MKTVTILITIFILGLNPLVAQIKTYAEKEISYKVDNITISGTLTIPDSENPVPVAILISGSFADNRDAERNGFKPFKEISNHLALNGIASFRYDDRGVGKSSGKHTYQYEIKDLANDVIGAIEILKNEQKINHQQIGLIGHSLGGLIAPMIASTNQDIAFIISLAGTIAEPDKVNINYRKRVLTQAGYPKEEIEKVIGLEERIVETTLSGIGYESLLSDIKAQSKLDFGRLPEASKKKYSGWEDYYNNSWYGSWAPFINTPFLKSFLAYNPIIDLEKVKCPGLYLFGSRDSQIRILDAGSLLIESLSKAGNNNFTIRVVPNADHYFVTKWAQSDTKFASGFLNILFDWINQQIEK